MEFFSMPKELLYYHVFPHLQFNELLRMRRVSQKAKELVEDYLQTAAEYNGWITLQLPVVGEEVDEDGSDLNKLLALPFRLRVKKLSIENVDLRTIDWGNEKIRRLENEYINNNLTHLNVKHMEIPLSNMNAIAFFENFPQLQYLGVVEMTKSETVQPLVVPTSFLGLRSFGIEKFDCQPALESLNLLWEFIERCTSVHLEDFYHPEILSQTRVNLAHFLNGGEFGTFTRLLATGALPNLKTYDIDGIIMTRDVLPEDFQPFLRQCFSHGVRLANVKGDLIENFMRSGLYNPEVDKIMISNVVSSIRLINKSSFMLEFPNLKKIDIWQCCGTFHDVTMPFVYRRQIWSNLSKLKIWVSTTRLGNGVSTRKLLKHFFVGNIRYEKMETLELKFLPISEDGVLLPYPRIDDIFLSCPRLTKLRLTCWIGSNKDITKIWKNLPLLEEVCFSACRGLTDGAFIGQNVRRPAITLAKNLKSLKLKRMDEMPLLTDSLFRNALWRMPLKQLYLQSSNTIPHNKITLEGLSGLKGGIFSRTIEKLAFNISLPGCSDLRLLNLQNTFRSFKFN